MKRQLALFVVAIGITSNGFGQSTLPNSGIEAHIAAVEQAGWTAWKNRDTRWFLQNTTREVVWINSDGVTDKSQFLKDLPSDCDVKAFALSDYKVTTKTNDLVVMTYIAVQDAICSGKKLPERIRASVVYVRRNDKWLETFYMETPLAK